MSNPTSVSADDAAAIRSLYEPFVQGLLAADFERLLRLYTADAVVMPPNHPLVEGSAAILNWMKSYPKVTRAEFIVDEIVGSADVAVVRGRYSMTLMLPNAGPVEDRGKYIEVRRKHADGSWPMWRDIFNSDLASAAP